MPWIAHGPVVEARDGALVDPRTQFLFRGFEHTECVFEPGEALRAGARVAGESCPRTHEVDVTDDRVERGSGEQSRAAGEAQQNECNYSSHAALRTAALGRARSIPKLISRCPT